MQTPLWVSVLVAGMGVLGTLGGVLITQRRADKRESESRGREREIERERWRREDVARAFEHRREACVEFHASVRSARDELFREFHPAPTDESRAIELGREAFKRYTTLTLYSSLELTNSATEVLAALNDLHTVTFNGGGPDRYEAWKKLLKVEERLFLLIRKELGVQDDPTATVEQL
ncbi:hypothetical protein [Paractinoplanes lichenicola]|uniref:Secreted protein n=1 Tax=Paractinoplanes lichenicola TaxID=2802976 RepID=A0ABS1VQK8_9ACTN|nr:hypothetical protein [Actinoplanes lichenicola]MBL7256424.1 hypothetical protein [Actinoplanes lichenicola]